MATYSGRLAVARSFIGRVALQSCSADVLFFLGTQYLYLGVLRLHTGVRYAVSVLVTTFSQFSVNLNDFSKKKTLYAARQSPRVLESAHSGGS